MRRQFITSFSVGTEQMIQRRSTSFVSRADINNSWIEELFSVRHLYYTFHIQNTKELSKCAPTARLKVISTKLRLNPHITATASFLIWEKEFKKERGLHQE